MTTLPGRDDSVSELWRWLQSHNPAAEQLPLDLDLDLIETRILRSLDFMNFIFFIEELSGADIEIDNDDLIGSLRTLRSIRDNLLDREIQQ
jgi:acyl carrier protein